MPVEVCEYQDPDGESPFRNWFDGLDARAAARITSAVDKIARGLMRNAESVGAGVSERKIDYGTGYRVYFGSETDGRTTKLVILLHGGTKKRQQKSIGVAKDCWKDYKARKRRGER